MTVPAAYRRNLRSLNGDFEMLTSFNQLNKQTFSFQTCHSSKVSMSAQQPRQQHRSQVKVRAIAHATQCDRR